MPENQVGLAPAITLKIEGGQDFSMNFELLEWASFINSGYIVRCRIVDPYFAVLKEMATQKYLEKARVEPTPLEFQIKWPEVDPTTKRVAYLAYLSGVKNVTEKARIEFVGIDPPSWWLNAGEADGGAWTKGDKYGTESGRVSDVIKSVIKTYAKGITAEVTDTIDSKENVWWMMRQDPKTFISSLLDWSSSITPKKSAWVVASVDRKIIIKEQAALTPKDFGLFDVNTKLPAASDVTRVEILMNNVISVFQTKLITQGISAISGEYIDKVTEEKKVVVDDENTPNKLGVDIGPDLGFEKPKDKKWATSIRMVPELSAGDLGVEYAEYIDGKARTMFMDMLNMVMRIKIRINGDSRFDDSSILGAATLTLTWKDAVEEQPYFLSGKWIIYGFHHIVTRTNWWTDLYLYRLDTDATMKKI
jgi:hypothetical protein